MNPLKSLGKTIGKAAVIGNLALSATGGCMPARTAAEQVQELKLQECSAETRRDINLAIQEIAKNAAEMDWNLVSKNCQTEGKYRDDLDCSKRTLETLRSDYMKILNKLLQTQENGAIYCPYGKSTKNNSADGFVVNGGDGSIYLNKPQKDYCVLQGVLMHEAGHLEEGTENIDEDDHDKGTDYVYTIGAVAEDACIRAKSSKKLDPIIDDIEQFLKERGSDKKK